MIPSISKVNGTVCTHVHFRVTLWKLAIFTNVGLQTDNIHIVDFPTLNSVISFGGFGSTPVQDIPNINRKILQLGLRIKFISEAWSSCKIYLNSHSPDRNNFITPIFKNLQPHDRFQRQDFVVKDISVQ